MSILIEALNVVVQRHILEDSFPGGVKGFEKIVPNQTLCMDSYLVRVGFMDPASVGEFIAVLERKGLRVFDGSEFVDVAVVDQYSGPTAPAPWLTLGQSSHGYVFAYLTGNPAGEFHSPDSWTLDSSLSIEKDNFTPLQGIAESLEYLDSDGNVHRVREIDTGKIKFIGGGKSTFEYFLGQNEIDPKSVNNTDLSGVKNLETPVASNTDQGNKVSPVSEKISSQEARIALISFLKESGISLNELRINIEQDKIDIHSLSSEVRWGLYYAGMLINQEMDTKISDSVFKKILKLLSKLFKRSVN